MPPFDGSITIEPKEGDLVIFPPWVPHQVGPTASADPRISIAFNIPGDWEATAGVAAHIPLERS